MVGLLEESRGGITGMKEGRRGSNGKICGRSSKEKKEESRNRTREGRKKG